jgi:hypothetical protein
MERRVRRITARERLDAYDSSENATRRLAHQDQRRRTWKMDHERRRKAEGDAAAAGPMSRWDRSACLPAAQSRK